MKCMMIYRIAQNGISELLPSWMALEKSATSSESDTGRTLTAQIGFEMVADETVDTRRR